MGQQPWKANGTDAGDDVAAGELRRNVSAESDQDRQAYLERLRIEIASGTYRVSAETLAAKLVRRIRWW